MYRSRSAARLNLKPSNSDYEMLQTAPGQAILVQRLADHCDEQVGLQRKYWKGSDLSGFGNMPFGSRFNTFHVIASMRTHLCRKHAVRALVLLTAEPAVEFLDNTSFSLLISLCIACKYRSCTASCQGKRQSAFLAPWHASALYSSDAAYLRYTVCQAESLT